MGCGLKKKSQYFDALFFYIGAASFNDLISAKDRSIFRWQQGLILRFNVVHLLNWAAERDLHVEEYLAHVLQASVLLTANKSSLAALDTLCESCSRLNSRQISRLLKFYQPNAGESPVLPELIDCLRARAMTTADVNDLEDDAALQGALQVRRNAHYDLPFRFKGPFHVESGLADDMVLAKAQRYLKEIRVGGMLREGGKVGDLEVILSQLMQLPTTPGFDDCISSDVWAGRR